MQSQNPPEKYLKWDNKQQTNNKRPQERREECHRGRLGQSGAVCKRLPPRPGSRTWRGNIWRCEFTPTCCLELCCVAWAILSCVCDSQWYCCSDPEWLLWYFGIWKRQNMAVESTVWIVEPAEWRANSLGGTSWMRDQLTLTRGPFYTEMSYLIVITILQPMGRQ